MSAKPDVNSVFKKKRNVPLASLNQIEQELNRLVEMGVLAKVEYSEWASATVYIKKRTKKFVYVLNSALKAIIPF